MTGKPWRGYERERRKRPELAPLARRVAALRADRGWSQLELALRSDVRQPTIALIETTRVAPTIGTLRKLAAALEVPLGDLLAGA